MLVDSRWPPPAINRGCHDLAITAHEPEGVREKVHRFPIWGTPRSPFEVTDGASAEPGALGQGFLGEASGHPVMAEKSRERVGRGVLHYAILARESRPDSHRAVAGGERSTVIFPHLTRN
jgi:hypothetical protein